MDFNLKSAFLGCKYAIPVMQAQGGGAIVNVASILALRNEPPGRDLVAYSASKAGLIQFSRSTAGTFARHGIRCNTVVPGLMHTPLVEHRLVRQSGGNDASALIARRNARPPLGRIGARLDVARAVLFLASDEAGYVTGTEIVVDGGPDHDDALSEQSNHERTAVEELTPATMTPEQKTRGRCDPVRPARCRAARAVQRAAAQPQLCDLVQRVGAYVRFNTAIPAALNELAICVVGRLWTAQFEFYAHRKLAIEAGVAPAVLDAIAAGRRPEGLSEDQPPSTISPCRCWKPDRFPTPTSRASRCGSASAA